MTLRCTGCVNMMCNKEKCKCMCHAIKWEMLKAHEMHYVQIGNGAVHYE